MSHIGRLVPVLTGGLLCSLLAQQAFALSMQDLEQKSRTSGQSMAELEAEYGHLLDSRAERNLADEDLYAWYKQQGEEAPAWLVSRLFPLAGTTDRTQRDGGDTPEEAVEITFTAGSDWTDSGTTVGFSDVLLVGTPPPTACNTSYYSTFSFNGPDAWYTFTLDDSYEVSATVCDAATYDSCLGILDENLNLVAVNDDGAGCTSWTSLLPPCCLPAGTYYVVVDSFGMAEGDYDLTVSFSDAICQEPCDQYANELAEASIPGSFSGSTVDAADVDGNGWGDSGFTLTLGTSGIYSFDACDAGTEVDVILYLMDASPCDGGVILAQSGGVSCTEGGATFPGVLGNQALEAGTYHMRVASPGSGEGAFTINVYSPCDAYEPLETVSVPSTLVGNTGDGVDIYWGAAPDVGYVVTIDEAGIYDFDACMPGSDFSLTLSLFDGDPCDGGALLYESNSSSCTAPWGAARLMERYLEAGSYHLLIGDDWTTVGNYEVMIQSTPERPTSGGPDEMGYAWINNQDPDGPEYSWVDISGDPAAVLVSLGDDQGLGPFPMGIDFPFYEGVYSEIYISSNGHLNFQAASSSLGNVCLPNTGTPNAMISMFWDDLDPGDGVGTVHYLEDTDNERFIVQFTGVPDYPGPSSPPNTFQAIMNADGSILIQLEDMQGDLTSATIGIENGDGTIGLSYNCNTDGGSIIDGTAVLFTQLEGDFIAPLITLDAMPSATIETELTGDYVVEATITDESGLSSANLYYTLNGGATVEVPLTNTAGDDYTGAIPHQDAGTTVLWWLEAVDASDLANVRITESYSFNIVSYTWPPFGLDATDGLLDYTQITWMAPVDPGTALAWFGGEMPAGETEALDRLVREHGLSKAEALEVWQSMQAGSSREFITYHVYRDGEDIATTTDLFYYDMPGDGAEQDVEYDYHVTAEFDSGESDASNTDSGYRGSRPTSGGPDAFGYIWVSSLDVAGPDYEWIDISGSGQDLAIVGDDTSGQINLPFDFPFYGNFYSSALVSSNGYLTFGGDGTDYTNDPIPTADDPNDLIAPFWDDLYTSSGGIIYYEYLEAQSCVVIQWQDVPHLAVPENTNTFQLLLYQSGIIQISWEDMYPGDLQGATVGIENSDASIGLAYNVNGEGGAISNEVTMIMTPPSNCEPVECEGIAEAEPNGGWADDTWNVIRCDDVICGELSSDGASTDSDWFLYTHFGGNIEVSLDLSDFDGRISLVEFENGGDTIAEADVFPRCFDEAFAVTELEGGSYFIVVEHVGDPDLEGAQSYSLSLTCSGDPCAGHNPIDCEGTAEAEPNEGWNADPPNSSYGVIALDETICGTVWAENGERDMDWFLLELESAINLTISCEVDAFDAALFLTEMDPAGGVLLEVDDAPACAPESLSYEALPAGSYFIVIGHNDLYGVPEEQAYSLTVSGNLAEQDMCEGYEDVPDFHDIWTVVADTAPQYAHHSGTGCPGDVSSPGLDYTVRIVLSQTTDLQVTMTGAGNADEVILLVGNCETPAISCGAAADDFGAGTESETLTFAGLPAGDYWLVADFAGYGEAHPFVMEIIDMNSSLAEGRELSFQLKQNHPNPFNPVTSISWSQPEMEKAELAIYNLMGEVVMQQDLGLRNAGTHNYMWDASSLSSGVYIYTLKVGAHIDTKKAVLLK